MFKIEKGIPIPERAGKNNKYPWRAMEVGDSFEIPSEKVASCRFAASYFSKRNGGAYKFTIRQQDNGTHRCWRIE